MQCNVWFAVLELKMKKMFFPDFLSYKKIEYKYIFKIFRIFASFIKDKIAIFYISISKATICVHLYLINYLWKSIILSAEYILQKENVALSMGRGD